MKSSLSRIESCIFDGCEKRRIYARGLCGYHYHLLHGLVQSNIRTEEELIEYKLLLRKNEKNKKTISN